MRRAAMRGSRSASTAPITSRAARPSWRNANLIFKGNRMRANVLTRILGAVLGIAFAAAAAAQGFPAKPVTIVVGFEPGGGTDTTARILQKPLGEQLGQQVIVENRAGAGGNI